MKLSLRPYQHRGLDEIRLEYRQKRRRPLYVLPTGGGKTVCYAAIAEGAAARGKRVLILEHRKELIRQASTAIARLGLRHQVVCPPEKLAGIRRAHIKAVGMPMLDPRGHVAVASVQTLAVRMDWLEEFDPDLIIIDEAHHAVAGTWARIIAACPDALLLGVTATPVRTNGQGLGDVFDVMVLGPSQKELIADGYLLPPRVVAPPLKVDLSKVRKRGGDLDADQQAELMMADREITGDAIEHYNRLAPGRPAIVFCANLKHAEAVAADFRAAGWRFQVIHGGMLDTERDGLIEQLADGRLHGLVNKDLISEGTDIPVAEVCILLRLTESESWYLQATGRVQRPVYAPGYDLSELAGRLAAIEASGKPFGLVIDHVGNSGRIINGEFVPRHGLPHDDRDWTLEGRKKRKRKGKQEEVAEAATQCPSCYAVHDPSEYAKAGRERAIAEGRNPGDAKPECPSCGLVSKVRAIAPPKQVAGTLVDVEDPSIVRRQQRQAQGAARTIDQLVAQGMSEGRARHVLEARAEKERMQRQLRDLGERWYAEAGHADVPLQRALHEAFGFGLGDIAGMKPKALREAVERVTEEVLRLQLGAPANDNGFFIRSSA